jgi:hypothetical protein
MGHVAPLEPGAGDEAQPVEQLAQGMMALRGILAHQREVGREKGPLRVRDIGWVGGAGWRIHADDGTPPRPQRA